MRQKTMAQFALGEVLMAVDNVDQVSRLIDRHLIRDMRGNLRAFGQQKVRCTKCGASYRRAPLSGTCNTIVETKRDPFTGDEVEVMCPGNVILTVSRGSVVKYDNLMNELIEEFGCNEYIANLYRQVSKWCKETFDDPDAPIQQTLF
jgi:DNA polymerase II large subunit